MLSHRENVRKSKFWQKTKEMKWNCFLKLTKGMKGFDLGTKKIQNYLMLVYLWKTLENVGA
jgi:hypothetical protein